jgi:DNA-directed RNA polymerase subunit RPC12/RpoP
MRCHRGDPALPGGAGNKREHGNLFLDKFLRDYFKSMAIKLDCPRCRKPLSVPRKKIGRYANCPRCGGRFWVPENAAGLPQPDTADSQPGTPTPELAPPTAEKPPATVSMGSAVTVSPGEVVPETPAGQNASSAPETAAPPSVDGGGPPRQIVPLPAPPVGAPSAAPPPRPFVGTSPCPADGGGPKTARFVAAEAAQSPLKLAEDGKLPELHLREGQRKENNQEQTTSIHPLVLLGLLGGSVALSIGLVLLHVRPPQSGTKDRARRQIEERFFPRDGQEPLEYQEYLMEAQRANTRGDRQAERKMYEAVLDLLRQERPAYVGDGQKKWSLTASPTHDEELKGLISILLSDD